MDKILILGSKPGAKFKKNIKVAYCANGSIGFYSQKLKNIKNIVNVVSARVLQKSIKFSKSGDSEFYTSKLNSIINQNPDKLVLTLSYDYNISKSNLISFLSDHHYKSPIEFLSPEKRINLQKKFTCLPFPLPIKSIFFGTPFTVIRNFCHFIRFRMGLGKGEVDGKFRPSTGVITLLYAINIHGESAQYIITGIGLGARNVHEINGKLYFNDRLNRKSQYVPHVIADKYILAALSKRFHITSEDEELQEILRI